MVNIGNSWDKLLADQWDQLYYQRLRKALIQDYRQGEVYPPMDLIFQALKLTDYKDLRGVILGQDPYHQPGQANGLAFSVNKGVSLPPSLINIYKEIENQLGYKPVKHGDLSQWARSGILLLNASLTVKRSQANSHRELGWQILTDRIIELINEKQEPVVFLLWGSFAQKKAAKVDENKHFVLKSSHPSPLSAYRGFFGNGHFKKAQELIQRHYEKAFTWQLQP